MSDELEDEYISRAMFGANHISRTACDFGTEFHNTAEAYAADRSIKIPFGVFPYWPAFKAWFDGNVEEVIYTELALTTQQFAIGGSIDAKFRLVDIGKCITDFKTQRVATKVYKTDPLERKVPVFYPGWCQQLATYAAMDVVNDAPDDMKDQVAKDLINGIWPDTAPQLVSVVIDSIDPGLVVSKLWTSEERNAGLQLGLACIRTWMLAKKYRPENCIL